MRVIYALLTAVFAVSIVATVGTWIMFAGLTAYDFAPGSADRPSSPGILAGHPQLFRAAVAATGVAVVSAFVLAILDRFRD